MVLRSKVFSINNKQELILAKAENKLNGQQCLSDQNIVDLKEHFPEFNAFRQYKILGM